MMRPVEEEVQIVDHEANGQEGWNAYANERMGMPGMSISTAFPTHILIECTVATK